MQMKLSGLISLTLLTLAACGGGGGGGEIHTAPTPTPPTPQQHTLGSPGEGGSQYYVRLNTTNRPENHALSFNDSSNIRKITIEGVTFDLADVGNSFNKKWGLQLGLGSNTGIHTGGRSKLPVNVRNIIVENASQNVTAGVVSYNNRDYAFFNGRFTPVNEIPASGKATYVVTGPYFNQIGNTSSQSLGESSTLTADFGNKTIQGDINYSENIRNSQGDYDHYDRKLAVKGNISGNRFESAADATTHLKGGFFGKNAAEIGGVFQTENIIGAFTGSKQ